MKRWMAVLTAMLLLLTGCEKEDDSLQRILQQYAGMNACSMEAVVRCEYESESREYTLGCTYEAGGKSTVTVHEPDLLQGVSIVYDGAQRQVVCDDLVLDAPMLGQNRLSAAVILPRLMDAVKQGWLLEESTEQEGEETLRRVAFETEEKDVKLYWTVWFDEVTGTPRYAEVSEDKQLFFTMEFTNFSFDDIMIPIEH
ncbi:MAG: hypothetical protein IKL23_06770 [Oscillospiraceae bacterium]|nr:hypothetical protein [Oscillospiraceae bacterium]